MSNLKDTFHKLKTSILGTKTVDIDTKLNQAVKDISSYRSNSGRNGYIDLVRSLITKSTGGDLSLDNAGGMFGQGATSPATFGQGGRTLRYKSYEAIISNINYCFRALHVLTDNILSPDDITKISLDIKPTTLLGTEEVPTESKISAIKEGLKILKIEENLDIIVKNTLLFGDFFCEIASAQTALTSKALLIEHFEEAIRIGSKEILNVNEDKVKIKIVMDYSLFHENIDSREKDNLDTKNEKNDENKIDVKNLQLLFHEPNRVVKLQSDLFPLCFGYLVFPKTVLNPNYMMQDQVVNSICTSILKSLEKRIPQISEYTNNDDLKRLIATMIKETDESKALNIRYVPPDRIQHFMVPSTKYYPYGESIFDSCQFTAKVLIALETALAIQRLSRSTEKRKIGIEIGLPRDARKMVEKLKEEFRKRKISLDSFGTIDTIPCLDLRTSIPLTNGKYMPLVDIIKYFNKGNDFEIYAYDRKSGTIVPDKIVSAKVTGKNVQVIKVTLDNDTTTICTPEHLWMLRDGTYLQAKDLKTGQSLMPHYTRSTKSCNSLWYTYEETYQPGQELWKLTHRVFGEYLGLYNKKDVVHHKDKNPRNNSSWNLEGCTHREHAIIHSNDPENGWNGKNIGKNQITKTFRCVICDNLFEKEYWNGTSTCSDNCFKEYKKQYSYNSWLTRKEKNEYKLISVNCSHCGEEIKVTKSKYENMKSNNKPFFTCDKKVCKHTIDKFHRILARTPSGSVEIVYKNCPVCGKRFISRKSDNRAVCSLQCTVYYADMVRNSKVKTYCDWCGNKIEIAPSYFKKSKFHACNNINCRRHIGQLNRSISKNYGKLSTPIYFSECIICDKLTCFSKEKTGYNYYTCGSKSCSSTAMHRGIIRYKKVCNHKVKKIEWVEEKVDVGDIQTENFHNFAITNGIFIHNSLISTFEDVYIPQKDGKSFVDIGTFSEGNVDIRGKVDELKFLRDSVIASLGIPPSFIGLEENLANKAALGEENILFARTIVAHQKYFTKNINGLIKKIFDIINPEMALTLFDHVLIALPPPKSLQFERESKYIGDLATLVEALERLGIPKEWAISKYLTNIDWGELKNFEINDVIDKKLGTAKKEDEGMGGMGGGGMGPGF